MSKVDNPRKKRANLTREAGGGYSVAGSNRGTKTYDLEERTLRFAQNVRSFVKMLPRTVPNVEDVRQLVRASGSVGANYIEANESLGKRDFLMKIKICRREAKESRFFLRLVSVGDADAAVAARNQLVQEATELMNIFGAIYRKNP